MQVIGIQIDRPFIRAALLRKKQKRIEICALKSDLLSDPSHVKQLYFPKFKGHITSGLSTKDILLRSIELKITDNRHLKKALTFHSEATTHFNPDEMISIPHLFNKNDGKIGALLFTAPKESLTSHLSELHKLGIDPDRVSAYSMALIRYIQWKCPSLENAFLIDLGSSEWTCALMEGRELKKSYSLSNGMETLLTSLWEDRKKLLLPKEVEGVAKQIDLLQLKSHLNPHLSAKINSMRQELTKIISSFYRISQQQPLIFTGHVDGFGHLAEFLTENFKESISTQHIVPLPPEEKKYAIAIGLGLEQLKDSVQLLQKEFFPKRNWRRTGLYSLALFSSSFFISFMLLLSGMRAIQARKSKMITALEKNLNWCDPTLKQSIFYKNSDEETILNQWITLVNKHNKEYPYILQSPKMGEVLLWLSNHPFLQQIQEEGEPIDIRSLHYQLVDCPTIDSPKDPYQAKVEIEFKTSNPMNARKFHELLLKGDTMINASRGIQWEMLQDSYRTSFFLKNRGSRAS